MSYQVASWDDLRLQPDLEALWRGSLAMTGDLAARLRWAYRDNPAGPGAVYVLLVSRSAIPLCLRRPFSPLASLPERLCTRAASSTRRTRAPRHDRKLLAESPRFFRIGTLAGASDMVGCAGLLPRRFVAGSRTLAGAMYGDFAVEPGHRTLLPALRLQREAGRHVARECHFGYGFPNAAAAGVFRRLGHVQVGFMSRYARVLRLAPHLRAASSRPLRWAAGAGALADRLRRAVAGVRRLASRDALALEWLDAPDARLDELFVRAARYLPIVGDRGREALAWRFFARPGSSARLAALAEGPGGRLRGYAVVTPAVGISGRPIAEIKDFLAASEADLSALLGRLCDDLALQGYATASVRFLGAARIVARLQAFGFERRSEERPFMVQAGENHLPPPLILDRESWYLTDGDEDW